MYRRVRRSIAEQIVGNEDVVRALMIALVSEGHVLLEGVPGIAKTQVARSFAQSLHLSFRRIQFTPDMLPSDILGATILKPRDQTFEFRAGPVFANVVLADEINRAPPKVQSALLEAMQERQVTIDGATHPLPRPFLVIATQNPIEQEGTYPLPEAELDRFLFRWIMGYPSAEDEVAILRSRAEGAIPDALPPVLEPSDVERLRHLRDGVYVGDEILRYLTAVVRGTRENPKLLLGASPRASVQFLLAAKAAALLDGRDFVLPDDVRDLAFAVLNHRVILRPEIVSSAPAVGGSAALSGPLPRILRETVAAVPVPR
ncbi:MAG TPA: MoxR family ATPase [Thermoplasmata archaeon]|nr:MoxR family ATPase [Thermoplasmata archaeon]